jgi:hypothetical protein
MENIYKVFDFKVYTSKKEHEDNSVFKYHKSTKNPDEKDEVPIFMMKIEKEIVPVFGDVLLKVINNGSFFYLHEIIDRSFFISRFL